jgi:DNA-binding winged helix-turn-helix (wHTH) protein
METVWPDAFVEESNLAQNVSALRRKLGERPDGGQYIETIPRRGYRFAAEVKASRLLMKALSSRHLNRAHRWRARR